MKEAATSSSLLTVLMCPKETAYISSGCHRGHSCTASSQILGHNEMTLISKNKIHTQKINLQETILKG